MEREGVQPTRCSVPVNDASASGVGTSALLVVPRRKVAAACCNERAATGALEQSAAWLGLPSRLPSCYASSGHSRSTFRPSSFAWYAFDEGPRACAPFAAGRFGIIEPDPSDHKNC